MPALTPPTAPTLAVSASPAGPPPASAIPPPGFLVWDDGTARLWCSGGRAVLFRPDAAPESVDFAITALPLPPRAAGAVYGFVETDPDGVVTSRGLTAATALPTPYRHRPAATNSPSDLGSDGLYLFPIATLADGYILPILSGLPCVPLLLLPDGVSQTLTIGSSLLGLVGGSATSWTP